MQEIKTKAKGNRIEEDLRKTIIYFVNIAFIFAFTEELGQRVHYIRYHLGALHQNIVTNLLAF